MVPLLRPVLSSKAIGLFTPPLTPFLQGVTDRSQAHRIALAGSGARERVSPKLGAPSLRPSGLVLGRAGLPYPERGSESRRGTVRAGGQSLSAVPGCAQRHLPPGADSFPAASTEDSAAATLSWSGEGRARRRPRALGGPGTQRVHACSTSPLVTPRTAPGVFARACRLPRGRVLRGRGSG